MKQCIFIKKLYTKRNNTQMDLDNMFLENDIPKLTEKEKILLEGPITYDEILFSLKNHLIIQAQVVMDLRMNFSNSFGEILDHIY